MASGGGAAERTDSSEERERPAGPDGVVDKASTFTGGGVAATVFFLTFWAVGNIGVHEAIAILESTLPTIRFLCSSVIAATSTVLALMLTLLGLTQSAAPEFDPRHFARIRLVASLCVAGMITAIGLLLFMFLPIAEASELTGFYEAIYWMTLVVAVVLVLRKAVIALLQVASPHLSHEHVVVDGG